MITRRSRLVLLIVPALALAAACTSGGGDASGSAASGDQALKIGLLAQLSGPSQAAGREAQNGAKLAVDVINGLNPSIPLPLASDAGLPNLGGAKVSLVVKDVTPVPEPDPAKRQANPQGEAPDVQKIAGDAVTDLVSNQGANALIGAYDPEVTKSEWSKVKDQWKKFDAVTPPPIPTGKPPIGGLV